MGGASARGEAYGIASVVWFFCFQMWVGENMKYSFRNTPLCKGGAGVCAIVFYIFWKFRFKDRASPIFDGPLNSKMFSSIS